MRVIIKSTITTVAPLSICMPVAEGATANRFNNFPLMVRGVDEDGNKRETGYLPSTTVRGFLRRAIVLRDMKQAADAGNPYKMKKVYAELIGQDAESEKQAGEIDLIAIREAREASPVIDLFGSGLGVRSRLKVSHFAPRVNILPDVYTAVRKDLDDTEQVLELMDKSEVEAFLGRSDANSRRAGAASVAAGLKRKVRAAERRGEPVDELQKELEAAQELEAKYVSEMGEMQVSSRTLIKHFALPAGIDLVGKMVIDSAKKRDLEMIQYALEQLSLNPILGAQSARGCGEISGSFEVMIDGKLVKKISIGAFEPARVVDFSKAAGGEVAA